MAIYHLNARHCQRSKGQSAAAKFDYITRQNGYEKQEDKCLYRSSGNMPGWVNGNSRSYWEAADEYERANASLGKEIEVALPAELNDEAKLILTRAFTRDLTGDRHPYTFALHEGYGRNPHAHIFISERTNDGYHRPKEQHFRRANSRHPERGGAPKNRDFQARSWLKDTRALWAERSNRQLELEGKHGRIDHRSYEDQGLLKVPTKHIGPTALQMARRGLKSERGQAVVEASKRVKELDQQRTQLKQDLERLQKQLKKERYRGLGLGR